MCPTNRKDYILVMYVNVNSSHILFVFSRFIKYEIHTRLNACIINAYTGHTI